MLVASAESMSCATVSILNGMNEYGINNFSTTVVLLIRNRSLSLYRTPVAVCIKCKAGMFCSTGSDAFHQRFLPVDSGFLYLDFLHIPDLI